MNDEKIEQIEKRLESLELTPPDPMLAAKVNDIEQRVSALENIIGGLNEIIPIAKIRRLIDLRQSLLRLKAEESELAAEISRLSGEPK